MIRLVTLFSGIRAIVLSHHRMEEEHVNVYACNNEEIDHIIAFEKETPTGQSNIKEVAKEINYSLLDKTIGEPIKIGK